MNFNQMVLIGYFVCMGACVLFIGAQLLWCLLIRLHTPRTHVRAVRVHGDVAVNVTVRPLRRFEE